MATAAGAGRGQSDPFLGFGSGAFNSAELEAKTKAAMKASPDKFHHMMASMPHGVFLFLESLTHPERAFYL